MRARGDAALIELTQRFDRLALNPGTLRIGRGDDRRRGGGRPRAADGRRWTSRRRASRPSIARSCPADLRIDDAAGLTLGMRWTPLDAVGLYVPGGKAAYPSSVLMNAMPARVAGVGRIAMCVPSPDGVLNPLVLAAARRAGVTEIYRVGGAQAVAALAYGTADDRPGGPHRRPRQRLCRRGQAPGVRPCRHRRHRRPVRGGGPGGRGPTTRARVAIDLLAQAEHDEAAQAILITDDPGFADAVAAAVEAALPTLPRAAIAGASWRQHGAIILVRDWDEAAALVNRLAPEHLQIMLPEAAGGVRHDPPCRRGVPRALAARKRWATTSPAPTTCCRPGAPRASPPACRCSISSSARPGFRGDAGALGTIGPAAVALAEAEGLHAHARSVALRLDRRTAAAP